MTNGTGRLDLSRLDFELRARNLTRLELCNLGGIEPETLRRVIRGRPVNMLTRFQIEAALRTCPVVVCTGDPAAWSWRNSPESEASAKQRRRKIRKQAAKEFARVRERDRWQRTVRSEAFKERARERSRRWWAEHRDEALARKRALQIARTTPPRPAVPSPP